MEGVPMNGIVAQRIESVKCQVCSEQMSQEQPTPDQETTLVDESGASTVAICDRCRRSVATQRCGLCGVRVGRGPWKGPGQATLHLDGESESVAVCPICRDDLLTGDER